MAWFKVDDGFYDHEKVIALMSVKGWEKSIALWTLTGSWSSKQETDGKVPSFVVKRFGFSDADAQRLVYIGLWELTANGFQFRNWAKSNPTHNSLEERREKARERVAGWRAKKEVTPTVTPLHTHTVTPVVTLPPTRPDPSQPSPALEEIAQSSASPTSAPKPFVVLFSCQGPQKTWGLAREQAEEWQAIYPGIGVEAECKKANAWLNANQSKRKTAKGMPAFLVNWLGRAANSGRAAPPPRTLSASQSHQTYDDAPPPMALPFRRVPPAQLEASAKEREDFALVAQITGARK